MSHRVWTTCAVLAALSLATPACSLMFVRPPPPQPYWPQMPSSRCTQSRFWPAADAIIALLSLSGVASGGSDARSGESLVGTGLTVAAFAASSFVGFGRTASCDGYHRFHAERRFRPPLTDAPPPPGAVAPPQRPVEPGDAPPAPEAFAPQRL